MITILFIISHDEHISLNAATDLQNAVDPLLQGLPLLFLFRTQLTRLSRQTILVGLYRCAEFV